MFENIAIFSNVVRLSQKRKKNGGWLGSEENIIAVVCSICIYMYLRN